MRALCAEAGCPDPPTYRGRCRRHARTRERQTHPNKGFYNSKRWRPTRRKVLSEQEVCQVEGCDRVPVDVDHIIPIEQGGAPYKRENLQALCREHHGQKTRAEQQTSGVGWPD